MQLIAATTPQGLQVARNALLAHPTDLFNRGKLDSGSCGHGMCSSESVWTRTEPSCRPPADYRTGQEWT